MIHSFGKNKHFVCLQVYLLFGLVGVALGIITHTLSDSKNNSLHEREDAEYKINKKEGQCWFTIH